MISLGKMAASVAAPMALGAGAAEVVSDEHAKFVMYLVGAVATVVAAITWIRSEMRSQIDAHSESDRARHEVVLAEIRHVREILALEFAKESITGEYPLVRKAREG